MDTYGSRRYPNASSNGGKRTTHSTTSFSDETETYAMLLIVSTATNGYISQTGTIAPPTAESGRRQGRQIE